MTSIRNNQRSEDRYLDAARDCILATGWTRTTLTDVARRAGVSRMTIYRTWPDMQTLLADLMTREWGGVVADVANAEAGLAPAQRLSEGVSRTVAALRSNDLLRKIVEVDPELLLPYLLQRRGRSQDNILGLLEPLITEGQADGSVRAGDPGLMARSVMLAAHGFTLSAETMTDDTHALDDFDEELRTLVERYLAP
ncbi:MAG TPA: TetR/AcrR family transcriptional regulator [Nocardioidaceae bacterium]|nr:TetR/AcrR family transcriptional regulator [Nocardioidaceae bacterium]